MGRDARLVQGTILWFNEAKDGGVILTEEGERLDVVGASFDGGTRPKGRCAQAPVTFRVTGTGGARRAEDVAFVTEPSPRRARLRHRSAAR